MMTLPRNAPKTTKIDTLGPDSLPVLLGETPHGSYRLLIQGGQLLDWTPTGEAPVIWLSPHSHFLRGKPPRGGIPICWPWFGPASEAGLPAHGTVRGAHWRLDGLAAMEDGSHAIRLCLDDPKAEAPNVSLTIDFTIGRTLKITLETHNQGAAPFAFSEALHSYFGVSDVRHIEIRGLGEGPYLDRADGDLPKKSADPLRIEGETDRIFLEAPQRLTLLDPGFARRISVSTEGAGSAIVWNPGARKAEALGDLGASDYLRMVCLESGNAAKNAVVLPPKSRHQLTVYYEVSPLTP